MTELSILLHAAARGARLQNDCGYGVREYWVTTTAIPQIWHSMKLWRIHPADEHLAWGPISGQYRDRAVYGTDGEMFQLYLRGGDVWGRELSCAPPFIEQWDTRDRLTRRTYLYLLAVALQSEGL